MCALIIWRKEVDCFMQNKNVLKKKLTPYGYLLPTIILMLILLVIPIVMVIGYSLFDNVIANKNPVFVGLANYKKVNSKQIMNFLKRWGGQFHPRKIFSFFCCLRRGTFFPGSNEGCSAPRRGSLLAAAPKVTKRSA